MLKFKRVNVVNLAKRYNYRHFLLDIVRQTAIERIVDYVNQKHTGLNKNEFIDVMLSNAKFILNKIIIEDNDK